MYQQKVSSHRTILNGIDHRSNSVSASDAQTNHNTVSYDSSSYLSGPTPKKQITIALDSLSAKNVLVSISATFVNDPSDAVSSGIEVAPFKAYTWVSSGVNGSAQDNFAPLPTDYSAIAGVRIYTVECDFLVPVLDVSEDEVQYVTVLVDALSTNFRFYAQMTAYSKEYDFWQPTK